MSNKTQLQINNEKLAALIQALKDNASGADPYIHVSSIEDCVDTSKKYVLPDGYIYEYREVGTEVFDDIMGTVGYTIDSRIDSAGAIQTTAAGHSDVTGFIPCKLNDLIRVKNMDLPSTYTAGKYWNIVAGYDSNKNQTGQTFVTLDADGVAGHLVNAVAENGQITQFNVTSRVFGTEVAYIRINAKNITDDSEVYVNSRIVTNSEWVNTGLKYDVAIGTGDGISYCKTYEITLPKTYDWTLLTALDEEVLAHINDETLVATLINTSPFEYVWYAGDTYMATNKLIGYWDGKATYGYGNRNQSETNYSTNQMVFPANNTTRGTVYPTFGAFLVENGKYYICPGDGYIKAGKYRLTFTW